MELRERLKKIRKDNGYTRERLAEELGLSYGTIAKYETGEREPGHGYIVKLAQKFGVTTDYVLGIEKPKPTPLPYSVSALELARQYDRLDSWGQAAVPAIAREGTARCTAPAACTRSTPATRTSYRQTARRSFAKGLCSASWRRLGS